MTVRMLAALALCGALVACRPATLVYDTAPGQAEAAASVMQVRLTALRMGSAKVSARDGQVMVELAARHRDDARRVLEPRGVLRFVRVDDDPDRMNRLGAHAAQDERARALGIFAAKSSLRPRSGPPVEDVFLTGGTTRLLRYLSQLPPELAPAEGHEFIVWKVGSRPARSYYLDVHDTLVVTHVVEAKVVERPFGIGGYAVNLQLTPEDGERFAQLTTTQVGKRLAFLLDDIPVMIPFVETPMPGGKLQLATDGSRDSSAELAATLIGGALPAPLVLRTQPGS